MSYTVLYAHTIVLYLCMWLDLIQPYSNSERQSRRRARWPPSRPLRLSLNEVDRLLERYFELKNDFVSSNDNWLICYNLFHFTAVTGLLFIFVLFILQFRWQTCFELYSENSLDVVLGIRTQAGGWGADDSTEEWRPAKEWLFWLWTVAASFAWFCSFGTKCFVRQDLN